jgi:ribonucleoside-diphosphate reductase alpha chain
MVELVHDGEQGLEHPVPRPLPRRRESMTRSFVVGGTKGYITTSAYEDGDLAEMSLRMAKQGSTLGGMMDAFSTAWSVGLQHGALLEVHVRKLSNSRAEPSGLTNDPELPEATSPTDYVMRRLVVDFMAVEDRQALGVLMESERRERGGQAGRVPDFTGLAMSASQDEDRR